MAESYPRRNQARGIWKINDITKNIKNEGTYPQAYSNKGFFGGGGSPNTTTIDQIIIQSAGNATDFGDLSEAKNGMGATGTPTRAFWFSGYTGGGSPNVTAQIDTINFATAGNCSDFGDMSDSRYMLASAGNDTRICSAGGYKSSTFKNVIDFITPTTLGNAIDFGDLTGSRSDVGGTSNTTRGVFFAGAPGASNVIDFIEFSTTGNAVDFGDLPTALKSPVGSSTSTNGYISGGGSGSYPSDAPVNTISEITIPSTGNAVDFGDLTTARIVPAAVCDNTKSVIAGGSTSPSQDSRNTSNVIDSFIMTTRGNATDFGDLTVARNSLGGACGGHGGIEKSQPRAPELYSPTGTVVPAGLDTGDIAISAGCDANDTSRVEFIQVSTLGNGIDFGSLPAAQSYQMGAGGSSTRAIYGAQASPSSNGNTYIEYATKGNTAFFGDLSSSRSSGSALSNSTRIVFTGGSGPSNVLDYNTITTLGNATDFGDLNYSSRLVGATGGQTRGLVFGGLTEPSTVLNNISYLTIGSTGNAQDFGDMTVAKNRAYAANSTTRAVQMGGYTGSDSNVIDYVTIASTSNATDFGDLTVARYGANVTGTNLRAVAMGSSNPSANTIDYITIASTGNATDFGDMTQAGGHGAAICNGHGGLS